MSAAVYLTLGILLAEFVDRRRLKSYFMGVAIVLPVVIGASRVQQSWHNDSRGRFSTSTALRTKRTLAS